MERNLIAFYHYVNYLNPRIPKIYPHLAIRLSFAALTATGCLATMNQSARRYGLRHTCDDTGATNHAENTAPSSHSDAGGQD